MKVSSRLAISLFSGAGIGDLGLRSAGFSVVQTCEIVPERIALAKTNFPEAEHYTEDIWVAWPQIVSDFQAMYNDRELDLLIATPPCQGMSSNGAGKLLSEVRSGRRPKLDPRNRLIIPAIKIAKALRPRWLVIENVPRMNATEIEDENGNIIKILDYVKRELGDEYVSSVSVLECADYGIPQRRQRLISIFTRTPNGRSFLHSRGTLIPSPTHAKSSKAGKKPWVTLREALRDFPPLDGANAALARDPKNQLHRVPVLDPVKYKWIKATPPGGSAFDNQCMNPRCLYQGNQTHGAKRDVNGINRASSETPLFCQRCGDLLPRPYTIDDTGKKKIMKGYTSAYKRMSWDLPAPTLTRNLSYPCSDHKVHPEQNRVLSLAEALRVMTIDRYDYRFGPYQPKKKVHASAPDTIIRTVIGEGVPPALIETIGRHLLAIEEKRVAVDPSLFDELAS